jgi:hypothetical protein
MAAADTAPASTGGFHYYPQIGVDPEELHRLQDSPMFRKSLKDLERVRGVVVRWCHASLLFCVCAVRRSHVHACFSVKYVCVGLCGPGVAVFTVAAPLVAVM